MLMKQDDLFPAIGARVDSNNYYIRKESFSKFGCLFLNDESKCVEDIKFQNYFRYLSEDVVQQINEVIAGAKFNTDLFNKSELSFDEINTIFNRSARIEILGLTGCLK